jgi:peptidoglycan-associated lipoprotein
VNHFRIKKLPVAVCLAAIVVLGGCHKKAVAPPPPPPPPPAPAPAPTADINATPSVINQGQYATLRWTTTNAASASISGIGTVAINGSQSVYPSESTTYTLTAKGAGGSAEATARVTVNPPPPPQPPPAPPSLTEEQLFEQNVHDIFFDYDKADIRPQDAAVAQQDGAFLASHPDMKIVIGGHCDERGSAEYNIALGQRRAESLQKALVADGVPSTSIRVVSYGKEKPFCTESNEQCWQQNRRDHLLLDR